MTTKNSKFKGVNLDDASVKSTLNMLKELIDDNMKIVSEATNMFDSHLEERQTALNNVYKKLDTEYKKLEKLTDFKEFVFPRLTHKQQKELIEHLME